MAETRPAMDEPSIYFAHLLDSIEVEEQDDTLGNAGDTRMVLVCQSCGENICSVDNGDDMRTLLNTVLQHRC